MVDIAIQNQIRKLRFDHDEMTQGDLAKKTGVSRQTIIAIESGKYFPTLELAFKIAHVFDTSILEVFDYSVLPPKPKKQVKASL